jgi:plastocyanin
MTKAAAVLAGLGVLVFAQLAFGGADQATTWNVAVGEQSKPPAGTPKGTSLNQYFPGRLAVNAGDKVTFTSFGFHTVTYLGRSIPEFLAPAKGEVYDGPTDSAGQPFYFDGEQKFAYNADLFKPTGGKAFTGKPVSSGPIPGQSPRKPTKVTYTFPKTGAFKLICVIHPKMEMMVAVRPKGATVKTPEEVAAQAKAETDAAWAKAEALANLKPPKNTIYMGVDGPQASGGRTTLLDFVPNLTTVKVGTKVRFVVKAPTEAHNAGFGPVKYMEKLMKTTDLFPFGPPNPPNQVTPFFIYGSDPPGTPYEGSSMHGNGFYSTPLADGIALPPPNAFSVSFAKAGKYHFICMLHGPDMAADIRVTN